MAKYSMGIASGKMIAEEVGVPLRDVEMMDARLAGADYSLNAQQAGRGRSRMGRTLEDDAPQAAETVTRDADVDGSGWLAEALGSLNARERMIIVERKLRDEPRTLENLGQELGLSKEQIRQLEAQALTKLRKRLESTTGSAAELLTTA